MFSYSQWLNDFLSKAAGHKYIKRVPYQSGGRMRYRYIYNVTHTHGGKHVLDPDHMQVGTKLMLDATSGAEVHGHIQSVSGDKVTFVYDDGPKKGESVTMSKEKLASELDKVHGISSKLDAARKKQSDVVAKLKEKGASAKQIARAEARLKALGGDTPKAKPTKAKPKRAKKQPSVNATQYQEAYLKLTDPKIKEVFDKLKDRGSLDIFEDFDEESLQIIIEFERRLHGSREGELQWERLERILARGKEYVDLAERLVYAPIEGGKSPEPQVQQSPKEYSSLDDVPKKLRKQLDSYLVKKGKYPHPIKGGGTLTATNGSSALILRSSEQSDAPYYVDKQGNKLEGIAPDVRPILKVAAQAPAVVTITKQQGTEIKSLLRKMEDMGSSFVTIANSDDMTRTEITVHGIKIADLPSYGEYHEPIKAPISEVSRALSIGEAVTLRIKDSKTPMTAESESAVQVLQPIQGV